MLDRLGGRSLKRPLRYGVHRPGEGPGGRGTAPCPWAKVVPGDGPPAAEGGGGGEGGPPRPGGGGGGEEGEEVLPPGGAHAGRGAQGECVQVAWVDRGQGFLLFYLTHDLVDAVVEVVKEQGGDQVLLLLLL